MNFQNIQPRRSSRIATRESNEQPQAEPPIYDSQRLVEDDLQIGHVERLVIAFNQAKETLDSLLSTRGRRSEHRQRQIIVAQQQVQEREEEAVRAEEELMSRVARHAPLIFDDIERLRSELVQAKRNLDLIPSVRGRPSEQHRQRLFAAQQLESAAKRAFFVSLRQLDQVSPYIRF